MSQAVESPQLNLVSTHMQVNFLKAAGWFLNDLNTSEQPVQRLTDYFKGDEFGMILNRVKDVMQRRGTLASGKLDIVVEPDGVVSVDASHSNLELQDQEQIRRDVVKIVMTAESLVVPVKL